MLKQELDLKKYFCCEEFSSKYHYKGEDLGATCSDLESKVLLWCPIAKSVKLNLYHSGDLTKEYASFDMIKGDFGVWKYLTNENLHGVYYDFTLNYDFSLKTLNGDIKTVKSSDPYAKGCGINGIRSMFVDFSKVYPSGWEDDKAPPRQLENIIYELHVKEFSFDKSGGFLEKNRGKYLAFTENNTTLNNDKINPTGIPYLKKLGVTHIQFMPIFDYGSVDESKVGFNWGYDPINYNCPEGSYSSNAYDGLTRIRELKSAILNLHKQGFRVIMDVVYNHVYSLESSFQKTMPDYFFRIGDEGEVLNASGCGNDIDCKMYMARKYIVESVLFWAREYHFDGFRFDLMGLHTNSLMNEIREKLDFEFGKGEKLILGEPWVCDSSSIRDRKEYALAENVKLLNEDIAMFSDVTRDSIKGSNFNKQACGFIQGNKNEVSNIINSLKGWNELTISPKQIVNYMSCHDDFTLWDKLSITTQNTEDKIKEYKLGSAIMFSCQGNLFFLSGEEFCRTKGGRHNTYNLPIDINKLDWNRAYKYNDIYKYYEGLIGLRKQILGLCDKSKRAFERFFDIWENDCCISFSLNNEDTTGSWKFIKFIFNANRYPVKLELKPYKCQVLVNDKSSNLWKENIFIEKSVEVPPISAMILAYN